MPKITLLFVPLLAIVFATTSCSPNTSKLKEGDLVFQCSRSEQSTALTWATGSIYTHCGIIIEKKDGLYVLEAAGPVRLTPYEKWKEHGRWSHVRSRRIKDEAIKIRYKKYLGQAYDWAFQFDNGKMYCSELIYCIYKEQFGIELAKPRKISDYNTLFLDKMAKRRGISLDQPAIAPSDLLE